MKTSELIEFLKTQPFTDAQAYGLIVADLFDFVPEDQVEGGQRLAAYFEAQIRDVLLAAIRRLRATTNPVADPYAPGGPFAVPTKSK